MKFARFATIKDKQTRSRIDAGTTRVYQILRHSRKPSANTAKLALSAGGKRRFQSQAGSRSSQETRIPRSSCLGIVIERILRDPCNFLHRKYVYCNIWGKQIFSNSHKYIKSLTCKRLQSTELVNLCESI